MFCFNSELQNKWKCYVKGNEKRQEILAEALNWISQSKGITVDNYLATHRHDDSIEELEYYFRSVIDWISKTFDFEPEKDMCGLKWGELYEKYHNTPYSTAHVKKRVMALRSDEYVDDKKNIYEYILGGEKDTKLLNIRLFEESTKKTVYTRQTEEAKKKGISNCPLCAIENNANKARIYKYGEMDADHVTAWSKGGSSSIENCQMLCKTHNRAKGNR